MKIPDFHPPERREEVQQVLEDMVTGNRSFCNIPLLTRTGKLIEVLTQVNITKWCGTDAIVGIAYDIEEISIKQTEEVSHRLSLESMLSDITDNFSSEAGTWELERMLEMLGMGLGVDRVYLFEFRDNLTKMDNTLEWCKPGIDPQIENLRDLNTNIFPWWMNELFHKRVINIPNVDMMPKEASAEKLILQDQDIKSVLVVPIVVEERLWGYIGFDQTSFTRYWKEENVRIIKIIAKIVSNSIHRKILTDALLVQNEELLAKNKELEDFTRSLFHEIQSPLVSIYSYAYNIKEYAKKYDDDELFNMVDIIQKNTGRLSKEAKKIGRFIRGS